jgi:glutathione S-transferase
MNKIIKFSKNTLIKNYSKDIKLYQYEPCPFSHKVKSVLDYYQIPYQKVEVNPITKKELNFSEYRKVPIVVLDEKIQINNSTDIIKKLIRDEKNIGKFFLTLRI